MKLIYLSTLVLILTSCAASKPQGKTEAEVLYKEAQQLVEDNRYLLAIEKLNIIKNRYPYSFYASPSELLQADILYMQENYIESAAAYMVFRDFHPKHKKIPYVIFRIAESYYNQLPDTFDRDLQGAVEAIRFYNEVLQKYPQSDYVTGAVYKIAKCKKMLMDKEQYIADFYFRTELYSAARWRYLDILRNFDNNSLVKHSMLRVVESSYQMSEFDQCTSYADLYEANLSGKQKKKIKEVKKLCLKKQ